MKKKKGMPCLFILIIMLGAGVFWWYGGGRTVKGKTVISGYDELKKELEAPGRGKIELSGNIRITGPIYVKGEKTLDGKGHTVLRETSKKNMYKGSLFVVDGSTLTVKGVVVSGGGANKNLKGGVSGALIEVRNGKLTLGKRGVLRNNINDKLATNGGGGVLVRENGKFYMSGGEISGNRSVMGGAGVRVESRGLFCMTGGKIVGNQSRGIGAVEDFDGRGGAIYNAGQVTIKGGTISRNTAKKFSDSRNEYGGVGGMLFNQGKCIIMGGSITDNTASSAAGAVYAAERSVLRITGGTIRGNRADRGENIYVAGGDCCLSKTPAVESLCLKEGLALRVEGRLQTKGKILLIPEKYKDKYCIVKNGKNTDFLLRKNTGFSLAQRKKGLYIAKKTPKPKAEKVVEDRGKSGQEAKESVKIRIGRNQLVFYENEYVRQDVLCYDVTAEDESDGSQVTNITVSKIVYPNGKTEKNPVRMDTSRVGTGSIYYKATDSRGKHTTKKAFYRIRKNRKAVIQMSPRYLFVWEVQHYSPEKWKEVLLANCSLTDDCETAEELKRDMQIDWNGLTENKEGSFSVRVSIRDQWGHRYYMKQNRAGRYGVGKVSRIEIPVTLVGTDAAGGDVPAGYVRFFPDTDAAEAEGGSEIWHFTSSDIVKIKRYMKEQENPFSGETNEGFLQRFQYCSKREEDTQGGEK